MLALLSGCDTGGSYKNTAHPTYGTAEYKKDLEQCRNENSKIVMTQGYDAGSKQEVDEPKAQACMTARGWQSSGR